MRFFPEIQSADRRTRGFAHFAARRNVQSIQIHDDVIRHLHITSSWLLFPAFGHSRAQRVAACADSSDLMSSNLLK